MILSATREEGAPTLEQLGAPRLLTLNVRTLDIARREVVDVAQVLGGNPNLRTDERRVERLGINVRPLTRTDLTLSVDFVQSRVEDPVAAFPIASPQVEAAFPDRFQRDGGGRLLRIDARPLNLASARQKQLRWGFNLTKPLGRVPAGMQSGMIQIPAGQVGPLTPGPDGTVTFRPPPGSAFVRNLAASSSRLFLSLYHNWYLEDSILLRRGLQRLDLLRGAALDPSGGRRRHEVELQAGAFRRGLGAQLSATWRSGTNLDQLNGSADRLRFASTTQVNIALFANVAERLEGQAPAWLAGTRVSFEVGNLLDTRPTVRDRAGSTPLNLQGAYLDPLGRTATLRLRRVF